MIKTLMFTLLGIFQLIIEFSVFLLILLSLFLKPFFLFYIFVETKVLENTAFSIKIFLLCFIELLFLLSLLLLVGFILFVHHLIMTDNLFMIVYIYLYTIDVYIYNPLGIPSNPLNLPWGRFK